MIRYFFRLITFLTIFGSVAHLFADGGMYPISMLEKVPLKKAGLKIRTDEIYNPNGTGLLQAVVQIGGCTGSFVSDKGLIITNHHCAFGGLAPYSSPQNNLFEKGYLAKDQKHELPIKGLTCKILKSHRDVSSEVLKGTNEVSDPVIKRKIINRNIEILTQAEQLQNAGLQIEISEMLPGKSYLLFRYLTLKDIRIVFIPQRKIGEFGGETDNWEWPRHTGDFSFIRAYTGRDGTSKEFDSTNIPFQPKEYLNINANGVSEGDFVFILGYPGRTYRHQPANFIGLQKDYTLPYISGLFDWEINAIKKIGDSDPAFRVKMEPRIKSLANTMKNYQGKIKAINNLNLYESKKLEETQLLENVSTKPEIRSELKIILRSYDSVYLLIRETWLKNLWYSQLSSDNRAIRVAYELEEYREKISTGKQVNSAETISHIRDLYRGFNRPFDSMFLAKMLEDASFFTGNNRITGIPSKDGFSAWYSTVNFHSWLYDSTYVYNLVQRNHKKLNRLNDPLLSLSKTIFSEAPKVDSTQNFYRTILDNLQPRYVDIRMEAMNETFIPDANRTLRLTYGYIKGYAPKDGVYYRPFTTVSGMIEKNGLYDDYKLSEDIAYLYKQNAHTPFYSEEQHDIPLCMLYNTDTTGGNSGSPVLNKYGELIGVNFDRSFEATVNDYAWDDAYSRSIGVDIRFVLWVTKDIGHADYLLEEMFIDK